MKLQKITYDDKLSEFDFFSAMAYCDDRIMTKLTLDDYDWMEYTFETWFPTKLQGFLHIKVIYVGTVDSKMEVEQTYNGNLYIHNIVFSSDLFEAFIKDYLTKHLASWDSEYAFCGEKEAITFYNTILDNIIEQNTKEVKYERNRG